VSELASAAMAVSTVTMMRRGAHDVDTDTT
jgi:hypothetical protein